MWGLIAYDTSTNTMTDITKHCLTATGCPSGPGAQKIGQQVFPDLNQASCWLHLQKARERNKARLVVQAALSCQAASYY